MRSLYRRFIYRLAISPSFWALWVLAIAASFVGTLFSSGGFFSFFPSLSILLVPALASALPRSGAFLPHGDMEAAFAEVLALLSAAALFLLSALPIPVCLPGSARMEAAALISGSAGLLLYLASAVALSVFFFSLLNHRGAAFAASSLSLALFNFAHLAARQAGLPRFASSLLAALSFSWHEDAASKGILDSRDIIFYAASFLFFTAASAAAVQRKRGNGSWNFRRQVALAVAALVLVIVDSNVYYLRLDVTKGRRFSVSPYSEVLLSELDAPLTISYYRSRSLRRLSPQLRDVEDFIKAYAASSRKLSYEILDPAEEGLEEKLEAYGIRGQDLELSGAAGKIRSTVFSAVVIRYREKTDLIPLVLSLDTLEYDLSSRIQALVRGSRRKLHVIVGNGLSLDSDYAYLLPWLSFQGFDLSEEDTSYLTAERLSTGSGDCILLLGSSDLTYPQAAALVSYLDGGGRAFIATAPYTVALEDDWSVERPNGLPSDELTRLLMKYGICFRDSLTASPSCFTLDLRGESAATATERMDYPLWPVLPGQEEAPDGLTLFWPCAIACDGEVAAQEGLVLKEGLRTDSRSWQYGEDGADVSTNPFSVPKTPPAGAESGTFSMSVRAFRDGRPAFYVLGDQYAFSSRMMAFSSGPTGMADTRALEFLADSLLRLDGQGELVKLKYKGRTGTDQKARTPQEGQEPLLWQALCRGLLLPLLLVLLLFVAVRTARERRIRRLLLILGKSS